MNQAEEFAIALINVLVSHFGPGEIESALALVLGNDVTGQLLADVSLTIAGVLRVVLDVLDPTRVKDELLARYKADDATIAAEFRAKFGVPL